MPVPYLILLWGHELSPTSPNVAYSFRTYTLFIFWRSLPFLPVVDETCKGLKSYLKEGTGTYAQRTSPG